MKNLDTSTTGRAVRPAKKVNRKRTNLNGHAVPLCENGKLRFRSREQAQAALVKVKHARVAALALGRPTRRREQRSYKCQACGGWHLTSSERSIRVGA